MSCGVCRFSLARTIGRCLLAPGPGPEFLEADGWPTSFRGGGDDDPLPKPGRPRSIQLATGGRDRLGGMGRRSLPVVCPLVQVGGGLEGQPDRVGCILMSLLFELRRTGGSPSLEIVDGWPG